MSPFVFLTFVIVAGFLFAKLEIAIEGAHGWAEKLPTWHLPKTHWASRVFFGGRPATGYHVWANLFILFLAHIPYLFVPVTVSTEFGILAALILMMTVEDFLWFVLNPAFGVKNFRKEKIWWHADAWWGIMPRGYVTGVFLASVLYYFSLALR